ncbi:uncharacterized protein LOC131036411 [Cryptomeria japonica]|uniref:uncharacterized protein LOC131036411 n=1 Tax=Cryptomeria japonica TaxID=3369 RepID=UPI0027DA55ED|nr:uncharacterized protein LOC131036411 [Cryptomeria japonica]
MANLALVLIGKFVGLRPNIESVCVWVSGKWKGKGQIEVVVVANGFFSFSFVCDEDLRSILVGGPWILGKTSLDLKKWEPGFNPKDWECNEAPIWVRPPGLPLDYQDEDIFVGLATCFGELLSVDLMTTAKRRLVYAHICVNIKQSTDLSLEISFNLNLGKWVQKLEYETIPFACFHYKKVGYWARYFPKKPQPKKVRKKVSSPTDAHVSPQMDPVPSRVDTPPDMVDNNMNQAQMEDSSALQTSLEVHATPNPDRVAKVAPLGSKTIVVPDMVHVDPQLDTQIKGVCPGLDNATRSNNENQSIHLLIDVSNTLEILKSQN